MMHTAQEFSNQCNCEPSDHCAFELELVVLLALRSNERPGVACGLWRGTGFALLLVAPLYLFGIYLWLR